MKNTFRIFLHLRKYNSSDFELRQLPIGARSEAAKSRREGKSLRNRVLRRANTQ
jgi:hypothetical protein